MLEKDISQFSNNFFSSFLNNMNQLVSVLKNYNFWNTLDPASVLSAIMNTYSLSLHEKWEEAKLCAFSAIQNQYPKSTIIVGMPDLMQERVTLHYELQNSLHYLPQYYGSPLLFVTYAQSLDSANFFSI